MDKLFTIIGKRISSKRKKLKYSQEYLAEITGLHRNHIGYIERGETRVTLAALCKITKVLKLPFEHLFKGF